MNGLGFAAVRDFNAFLRVRDEGRRRHAESARRRRARGSTPRSSSQPGRMLNDFRHLGFNQAENGKKVFDGMMQWIAAGDGINMNYRFSQPGRTERNRQDQLYAEGVLPVRQRDDDRSDHRQDRQPLRHAARRPNTCPLAMEIYSANEYWVKAASLLHTDPDGHGGPARLAVRAQLLHLEPPARRPATRTSKGTCQQFRIRSTPRRCSARCSSRSTTGSTQGIDAAAEHGAAAVATARSCRRCRRRAWASRTSRASPTPG